MTRPKDCFPRERAALAYVGPSPVKRREPDARPARWGVGAERNQEEEMWLALAAITLAAAIGFNVLALAIQFEQ